MARGRGGSVGSGGGRSSSTSCKYDPSSCYSRFMHLYGHRYTSLYSDPELYGQLVVYSLWCIALALLLLALSGQTRTRSLQASTAAFAVSLVFLCVRFGLLIGDADARVGYRYEGSVVVLLQRLGAVFLFAGVFATLQAQKLFGFVFWPLLAVYAALSVTYIGLDFAISAHAIKHYGREREWPLGDRDFGLLFTGPQVESLKTSATGDGLNILYVMLKLFDPNEEAPDQVRHRSIQVKIGAAMDVLSLGLALFIGFLACLAWIGRKNPFRETFMLLLSSTGLLLYALFRTIVTLAFVLWNWNIINDDERWMELTIPYIETEPDIFSTRPVPPGFLDGYRTTAKGFPVVQAVFEMLGIVMACAAAFQLLRMRRRSETLASVGGG